MHPSPNRPVNLPWLLMEGHRLEEEPLGGMEPLLFVVARTRPDLADRLRTLFAAMPIRVVLDRRQGERRRRGQPGERERRRTDRRASWVPRPRVVDLTELTPAPSASNA